MNGSRFFRSQIRRDFIRVQREQGFAFAHGLAISFVPDRNDTAGYGFTNGRDFNFNAHKCSLENMVRLGSQPLGISGRIAKVRRG